MLIATTSTFVGSLEHILGFLVVVFALTLLWMLTAAIGTWFKRHAAPVAASAKKAPPIEEPDEEKIALDGANDPSEEEVAAITACVALLMGKRSRIISVRSTAVDWSREGRREHFASHRIR